MFFRWTLSVLEQSYKRNQITKSPRGAQGSLAATLFGHLIADKKVGAAGPSFGPFLAPLGPLRASLAALPLLSSAPLWAPWPSLSAFLGLLLRPLRLTTFCVKVVRATGPSFGLLLAVLGLLWAPFFGSLVGPLAFSCLTIEKLGFWTPGEPHACIGSFVDPLRRLRQDGQEVVKSPFGA